MRLWEMYNPILLIKKLLYYKIYQIYVLKMILATKKHIYQSVRNGYKFGRILYSCVKKLKDMKLLPRIKHL